MFDFITGTTNVFQPFNDFVRKPLRDLEQGIRDLPQNAERSVNKAAQEIEDFANETAQEIEHDVNETAQEIERGVNEGFESIERGVKEVVSEFEGFKLGFEARPVEGVKSLTDEVNSLVGAQATAESFGMIL